RDCYLSVDVPFFKSMSDIKTWRILHLEDDPDYCALVRDLLAEAGCADEIEHVSNRTEYEAAITTREFDLILGDFSLPDYSGLQALTLARSRAPQTPFLLVSGKIGRASCRER